MKTDCALADYIPGLPAFDDITLDAPDNEGLLPFYEKYGFKGLAAAIRVQRPRRCSPTVAMPGQSGDLFADHSASTVAEEAQHRTVVYDTILNWADFDQWLERLHKAPLTAIDTETDSLDEMRAQIVGISSACSPAKPPHPLRHEGPDAPAQLPLDEVLARLKPWLEDPSTPSWASTSYDRHVFANHGIEVQGYAHDTMLQSYVLEVHKPHNLTSLAERHTGRKGISYEDLCGKGAHQIPFAQVPVDKAAAYSCEDSDQTLDVHNALWPLLQADDKLRFIYELEIASSEALYRIERNGVLIDAPTLAAQSHELGQRILQLETEAYEIAGQPFNLSSPKQLGEIFFDKLGMPVVKKTATGARSTDEEVLEKLAEDYPLPAKLLEHRSLVKLKGTYTDKLAQLARARTGRVHTHYAQAVAVTGRLSSNDPNLQNIPIQTPKAAACARPLWPRRPRDCQCRLLPDRAAHHGPPERRPLAAARLPRRAGRAPRHRRRSVWGGGRSGHQRATPLRQGHQLWPHLRHEQLWPGQELRHRNQGRRRLHRQILPALPGVKVHGRHQGRRQIHGLCRNRVWPPPVPARNQLPNGPAAPGPNAPPSTRPCRARRPTSSSWPWWPCKELDAHKPDIKMIMQVHDELVFELPESEVDWLKTHIPRLMAEVAALKVPLLAEVGVGLIGIRRIEVPCCQFSTGF